VDDGGIEVEVPVGDGGIGVIPVGDGTAVPVGLVGVDVGVGG